MIEPIPNIAIYAMPLNVSFTAVAVRTSNAADPARPCIIPMIRVRMGNPVG